MMLAVSLDSLSCLGTAIGPTLLLTLTSVLLLLLKRAVFRRERVLFELVVPWRGGCPGRPSAGRVRLSILDGDVKARFWCEVAEVEEDKELLRSRKGVWLPSWWSWSSSS